MPRDGTVAAYIAGFRPEVRKALKELRTLVRAAAPKATEKISYGIAQFSLGGRYLVYIAGFKNHVSLYPMTGEIAKRFRKELAPYLSGKGTMRIPLGTPIPKQLIRRIVKTRIAERERQAK
jgi:uncharacterized protein YdhG (YjbR/CyaY superfamily)